MVNDEQHREPRKRILTPDAKLPAVADELQFVKNLCSHNARKKNELKSRFTIEIWYDKHYHDRNQHGDDAGKRKDIGEDLIDDLVLHSIDHLIFYGALIKGFTFLNYRTIVGQPHRIILRKDLGRSILHVVIQVHYVEHNWFEVTVITAMCAEDFRIATGQYVVDLQEDGSILYKYENKKFSEIHKI